MNKKPINSNPTKEFFTLLKTIESKTKNQARISSYNPDDISSFMVEISPQDGVYKHAKFLFQIQLMLYPREFPNVVCLSDIYHPNIEYGEDYHNVCLNLFDNWNRSFGLIDVIQGLIFLLYQPNINDPISSLFSSKNTSDETFRKNVHISLHGGVIDGVKFLPNPGIIEYNEIQRNRCSTKEEIIDVENIVTDNSEVVNVSNDAYAEINNDRDVMGYGSDEFQSVTDDDELANIMLNNNAAHESIDDCDEEAATNVDEETEEDLPTKDIISSDAFYSDLICSRYSQSDKFSESECDINNVFLTSMSFEFCEFRLSPCGSFDSDHNGICMSNTGCEQWHGNGFCNLLHHDDIDDSNDTGIYDHCNSITASEHWQYGDGCCNLIDDEVNDWMFDTRNYNDKYVCLVANRHDPSNVFLSKWMEDRINKNQSQCPPNPMTAITRTNVLNPFHDIIGVFVLYYDTNNCGRSNWSVRRIENRDRTLHLMSWVNNVLRWSLTRQLHCSLVDIAFDQIVSYSLFVAISGLIRSRLANAYNYGSDQYHSVFVR